MHGLPIYKEWGETAFMTQIKAGLQKGLKEVNIVYRGVSMQGEWYEFTRR